MSAPDLAFAIHGDPAPGGSKNGFVPKLKDGSYARLPNGAPKVVIFDDSKRNKSWRGAVVEAVRDVIAPTGQLDDGFPLDEPVELAVVFTVAKPKTVRRAVPTVKPDALKLLRSTEDALKDAGLVKDDALIWRYRDLAKVYPGGHELALPSPGAVIYVWRTNLARELPAPAAGQLPLGLEVADA